MTWWKALGLAISFGPSLVILYFWPIETLIALGIFVALLLSFIEGWQRLHR